MFVDVNLTWAHFVQISFFFSCEYDNIIPKRKQHNIYFMIFFRRTLYHELEEKKKLKALSSFFNTYFIVYFPLSWYIQVITIFSASNYYAIGSNKGAYLKLDPQLDTHFVQYTAAASKTRKLTFRQKIGLVESSALRELGAKLRERKVELEKEFRIRDQDSRGK